MKTGGSTSEDLSTRTYRGSVKDVIGPFTVGQGHGLVFDYTDAYSVFDWGRMPDALPKKGEALATLAADLFERIEKAAIWREFSKSAEALGLRKGNRFGSVFNEVGENLQTEGLRTHYLGVLSSLARRVTGEQDLQPRLLSQMDAPVRYLLVKPVHVVRPAAATVLGRALMDYLPTRQAPAPKLIPLEVVFRFGLPPGSSLLERCEQDPGYLSELGYAGLKAEPGAKWDFPVLELFTKLESTDRPVSLGEALGISGLSAAELQEVLLRTAWVAGLLRWICSRVGLELADGKLEWGLGSKGEIFLVDAIGPDELRLLRGGVQVSKEFLRTYYRQTPWYEAVGKAKAQAKNEGSSEWKRRVAEGPPPLPVSHRELATQMYLSLANHLTGKSWFAEAWSLDRVAAELGKL